jgi:N-hydroxyarylamine O-acetyltransferase
MSHPDFDLTAWLDRINYNGARDPTLATLRAVVAAHCATIPYESVDVLLGEPPKLDVDSLQRKMVRGRRGGYCFEQNLLM